MKNKLLAFLAAIAVTIGLMVLPMQSAPVSAVTPTEVVPMYEIFVNGELVELAPMSQFSDSTWYFGSGGWGECYRWVDNNEGHMRCRTASSYWPRVTYQVVTSFRDQYTFASYTAWGPARSVDGSAWGSWSDVYSQYGNRSQVIKNSYYITW
jgi:hypothetical protein